MYREALAQLPHDEPAVGSPAQLFGQLSLASTPPKPSRQQLQIAVRRLRERDNMMQRLWASIEGSLAPGVKFYLTVLLTIATANSLCILVSKLCSLLHQSLSL